MSIRQRAHPKREASIEDIIQDYHRHALDRVERQQKISFRANVRDYAIMAIIGLTTTFVCAGIYEVQQHERAIICQEGC